MLIHKVRSEGEKMFSGLSDESDPKSCGIPLLFSMYKIAIYVFKPKYVYRNIEV